MVINKASERGIPYEGFTYQEGVGHSSLIKRGSKEEHIIADWMESGLGVPQTTVMVNEHRTDYGLPHVGKTCVRDKFHRMRPTLTKLKRGNKVS